MKTWKRSNYMVEEQEHDYCLHKFVVTQADEVVYEIVPDDREVMAKIIKALDNGEEINGWEDGNGNTIKITPLYWIEAVTYDDDGTSIDFSEIVTMMRDKDEALKFAETLQEKQGEGYGVIVNEWTTEMAITWVAEFGMDA